MYVQDEGIVKTSAYVLSPQTIWSRTTSRCRAMAGFSSRRLKLNKATMIPDTLQPLCLALAGLPVGRQRRNESFFPGGGAHRSGYHRILARYSGRHSIRHGAKISYSQKRHCKAI